MPFFTADLIAALKTRWRLEAAIFVVILLLVAAWTAISPRTYEGTASLLFDESPVDPVDSTKSDENVTALLATQADVLQSQSLATDVARLQQLANPQTVDQWRRQTGGVGDVNAWIGSRLLPSLDVTPERASRVLQIHFTSPDPNAAALIANGFATAYVEARLRQKTDPARTYSRWFEDRTREVRTALETAQAKLTAFQRKTGIVDTGPVNAEGNRLNELSSQLAGAEASSADLSARAGSSASQSIDVQSSGVVQQLRTEIAAKSATIAQMSSNLGPNHPDRLAAEAELATLRGKLASEIGTTTRSVQVASGAASGREANLRGRLNAQRGRMLGLAGDRAQLDVLQRDVDSARDAYNAVTTKLGTMRLQSEAPSSNARQLDYATPPSLPKTPNVPLRLFLGALLGALLAVGVAVVLELWRPRVRTASGIVAQGGVPVIARIDFKRSSVGPLLAGRA